MREVSSWCSIWTQRENSLASLVYVLWSWRMSEMWQRVRIMCARVLPWVCARELSWMWGSSKWCAGNGCCFCCWLSVEDDSPLIFSPALLRLFAHTQGRALCYSETKKRLFAGTRTAYFFRFKSETLWLEDPARNGSYLRTLFIRSGSRNMELGTRPLVCV